MSTTTPARRGTHVLNGIWRGVGFRVEVPESLSDALSELLPPGWDPAEPAVGAASWSLHPEAGGWSVSRADGWTETWPDADVALPRLVGDVELHVAEHATDVIAVHAGVVVWHGQALVLPGRTMAGKSTLVHRLVAAGAQYCSDEYALLTRDGLVLPYPRPLSLRSAGGGVPTRVPPAELGAVPAEPVPVGLVAALEYRSDLGWQGREVPSAEAAMAMLDNTVAARSRPVEAMDHVCAAAAGSLAWQGFRGEADEAVDRLLGLMQQGFRATRE